MSPFQRPHRSRPSRIRRTRRQTSAVEFYGDAVDDVRLLRRRDFVVVREGERCRVGNSLCSLAAGNAHLSL